MRRALALAAAVSISLLFLPTAALAGGFCMGYGEGGSFTDEAGTRVTMSENCFSPTVIRVNAGDTVTFVNADPQAHGVGGAAGSFGDAHAEIAKGASVGYRFDEEGVFPYACVFHPGMTGAVVVGDGGASAAVGTVAVEEEPPSQDRAVTKPADDVTATSSSVPLALALGIAIVLLGAAITALTRRSRPRAATTSL